MAQLLPHLLYEHAYTQVRGGQRATCTSQFSPSRCGPQVSTTNLPNHLIIHSFLPETKAYVAQARVNLYVASDDLKHLILLLPEFGDGSFVCVEQAL